MSTTTETVTVVNANFEKLAKYENVLIYYPSSKNDKFLKFIAAHDIKAHNSEPVHIPGHFRRGDIIGGKFVTKHFFLDANLQGQDVIVDIEVVLKTDYSRNNEETIVLNITMKPKVARANHPSWKIKVGTDKVPLENGYKIPNTEKYIAFEPTK